jgi:hypothetical protein
LQDCPIRLRHSQGHRLTPGYSYIYARIACFQIARQHDTAI